MLLVRGPARLARRARCRAPLTSDHPPTGVPSATHSARSTRTSGNPNSNVVPSSGPLAFSLLSDSVTTFRLQTKDLLLHRHANQREIATARLSSKSGIRGPRVLGGVNRRY